MIHETCIRTMLTWAKNVVKCGPKCVTKSTDTNIITQLTKDNQVDHHLSVDEGSNEMQKKPYLVRQKLLCSYMTFDGFKQSA